MEFTLLVAMAALVMSLTNLVKFVRNGEINGIVTTLGAYAIGVGVIFLAAQTDWSGVLTIGELPLDKLNGWSLVMLGLTTGGTGSTAYNFTKAVDNSDSAKTSLLIHNGK